MRLGVEAARARRPSGPRAAHRVQRERHERLYPFAKRVTDTRPRIAYVSRHRVYG